MLLPLFFLALPLPSLFSPLAPQKRMRDQRESNFVKTTFLSFLFLSPPSLCQPLALLYAWSSLKAWKSYRSNSSLWRRNLSVIYKAARLLTDDITRHFVKKGSNSLSLLRQPICSCVWIAAMTLRQSFHPNSLLLLRLRMPLPTAQRREKTLSKQFESKDTFFLYMFRLLSFGSISFGILDTILHNSFFSREIAILCNAWHRVHASLPFQFSAY